MKKPSKSINNPVVPVRWSTLLPAAFLILLAGIVFFELAGDVWLKEGFSWDPQILLIVGSLRSPLATVAMRAVTTTASGWIAFPVLAATIWFVRTGDRRQALILALGFLGAILLNTALKAAFARPRPHIISPLTVEHTASFPSGHTISAVVFYGYLALAVLRHGWRSVAALVTFWAVLVGLSRIYLGVHYPSDVLASFALGLVFILLMRGFLDLSYRSHNIKQ